MVKHDVVPTRQHTALNLCQHALVAPCRADLRRPTPTYLGIERRESQFRKREVTMKEHTARRSCAPIPDPSLRLAVRDRIEGSTIAETPETVERS